MSILRLGSGSWNGGFGGFGGSLGGFGFGSGFDLGVLRFPRAALLLDALEHLKALEPEAFEGGERLGKNWVENKGEKSKNKSENRVTALSGQCGQVSETDENGALEFARPIAEESAVRAALATAQYKFGTGSLASLQATRIDGAPDWAAPTARFILSSTKSTPVGHSPITHLSTGMSSLKAMRS